MGKRSNGCITCRRRKVKCDETKPTCVRCSKATYSCAGYDQPWLDETPYIELAQQRAAEREKEYRASSDALIPYKAIESEGFLPVDRVADSVNLSAFKDDICRSFILHRLCAGPDYPKAMSWWLSPTPKVEVQSRTLVSASRAMSAAFFGRVHQQATIITEGEVMYGEALRNLQIDLRHSVKAYTFETLGATMALHMYELVHMRPGTPGLISHAGGIGKLIEVRGPNRHKTYPEKTVFLESRMLLVTNGIYGCERTFLEDPVWKDVPWEDDMPAKVPFDYFVDILSDIPSFLQQVTCNFGLPTAVLTPSAVQVDYALLRKQVFNRLETIKRLREEWHAKYNHPVRERPPSVTPTDSPHGSKPLNLIEPPFKTALYFADMYRASDFCISTAILILLFMLYEQVSHGLDPSLPYPSVALQTLFPEMSLQSLVQDICRCTEYMLLRKHGSRGYIVLLFPASVAYFASDKDSLEAKWLYDVCKRHAGNSGFGFGDLVLDQVMPLSKWMDDWKKRCALDRSLHQNLGLRTAHGVYIPGSAPTSAQMDAPYNLATLPPVSNAALVPDDMGKGNGTLIPYA